MRAGQAFAAAGAARIQRGARRSLEPVLQLVRSRFGLEFSNQVERLEAALRSAANATERGDVERYMTRLLGEGAYGERLIELAQSLTVGETYFFRHSEQLEAVVDAAFRPASGGAGEPRALGVLSAGCSTGEEPYTLSMLINERFPGAPRPRIEAIDLNREALAAAREGRYGPWALRQASPEARARYFDEVRGGYRVKACIRAAVRFETRNLMAEDPSFWAPGRFDLILCRNVLIYFGGEARRRIVRRFHDALRPGGLLVLGHAETLRGISTDFELRHEGPAFFYERKAPSAPVPVRAPGTRLPPEPAKRRPGHEGARLPARPHGRAQCNVPEVLSLIRRERYDEALAQLELAAKGGAREPEELLVLRAALCAIRGRFAQAEAVCRRILAANDLSAAAHYILAVCKERQGKDIEAVEHDRIASYLDPGFAMPRFHLGLLCQRRGEHRSACRHFSGAELLLAGEEPVRLLLFGGGFSREALIAVARRWRRGCEEASS